MEFPNMEPREFTLVTGEQFLKLWDQMNITLFQTLTLTGRANKGQDFFLMGSVHISRKQKDSWLGWNHTTSSGTRWLVEIMRAAFETIPPKTIHSEMFCLVGALLGGGNLLSKDFQANTPWKYFHKYLGISSSFVLTSPLPRASPRLF
jgi:hypothetical protein